MLASVGVYAGVPLLLALPETSATPPLPPVLFTGLGLATAGAALALQRLALRGPIARGELDPTAPDAAPRVLTVSIVSWALAETPALLGLVLALLGGGPRAGWGLALLSLATLLALAPRFGPPARASASLARPGVKIG
jgi:F0F1-type ATP synthase membrane subunit c/vacuolar-type H+-ATPase subunit K